VRVDTAESNRLAAVLVEPGQPLGVRQAAAVALAEAGDRRAFETLVLLLNHRDPERGETAARALAVLGDPRTGRAAAALATNPIRVGYALHPIRLLVELRAPEAVPALSTTLRRLLAEPGAQPYWRIALACVEGLGALGDPHARPLLAAARLADPRLRVAADAALSRIGDRSPPGG
jgi:HEAT repeat protein